MSFAVVIITPRRVYLAHYNLCRVHEALKMTPAKALGIVDRTWAIGGAYRRGAFYAAHYASTDRT